MLLGSVLVFNHAEQGQERPEEKKSRMIHILKLLLRTSLAGAASLVWVTQAQRFSADDFLSGAVTFYIRFVV